MRLLLDTHAFLWFIGGSHQLSDTARALIENPQNERLLSAASLWEIAIKARLGKLEADPRKMVAAIDASGFIELSITAAHAALAAAGILVR